MYAQHVPIIAAGMRLRPAIMERGIIFAILSARQQFISVPDQLAELERDGDAARCLFSWKYGAYRYVREHRDELYHRLRLARSTRQALYDVTRIPGMGIVKGAFVLQLLGHDIACLDSQNNHRENLNPREYRSDGELRKIGPAFWNKLDRYILATGGQAQQYWDAWCEYVSDKYAMSAEECSRIHLCIVPPHIRARLEPFYGKIELHDEGGSAIPF